MEPDIDGHDGLQPPAYCNIVRALEPFPIVSAHDTAAPTASSHRAQIRSVALLVTLRVYTFAKITTPAAGMRFDLIGPLMGEVDAAFLITETTTLEEFRLACVLRAQEVLPHSKPYERQYLFGVVLRDSKGNLHVVREENWTAARMILMQKEEVFRVSVLYIPVRTQIGAREKIDALVRMSARKVLGIKYI